MRTVVCWVLVLALWVVTAVQLVSPPPHAPYLRDGKDLSPETCEPSPSVVRAREEQLHGDHSATKVRCPGHGAGDYETAMSRFEHAGRGSGPGWGNWARVDGGALAWCTTGGPGTGTRPALLVGRVPRDPPRNIDFSTVREVRSVLPPDDDADEVELMVVPTGLVVLAGGYRHTRVLLVGSDLTQRAQWEVKAWPRRFRTHLVSSDDQGLVIAVEQTPWLDSYSETSRWRLVQLSHSLVPTGKSMDVRAWSRFSWFGPYEGLWTTADWVGWNRGDFPPCILANEQHEWFVPGPGLRPWMPGLGERVAARGGIFNWVLGAVLLVSALLAAHVVRAGRLRRELARARLGENLWEGRASPLADGSSAALLHLADDATLLIGGNARRVGFARDEVIEGPCVVLGERTAATHGAYRREPTEMRPGTPHVVFRGSLADARAQATALHDAALRRAVRTGFLLHLLPLLVTLAYLNRG